MIDIINCYYDNHIIEERIFEWITCDLLNAHYTRSDPQNGSRVVGSCYITWQGV